MTWSTRIMSISLTYCLLVGFPPGSASAAQVTVLHSFGSGTDGQSPSGNLADLGGVLYGTTSFGGTYGHGTVFRLTRSGKEETIYSFKNKGDGGNPYAGLFNFEGVLYGTTLGGGTHGYGTVFKIAPAGVETVLHSFGSGKDGASPSGRLASVGGIIYGTTYEGGAYGGSPGEATGGVVYTIATSGAEKVLYSFGKTLDDGNQPTNGLINVAGTLYGATNRGGVNHHGEVFSISTSGATKVIYQFKFTGDVSVSSCLADVNGTLYGMGLHGGLDGRGAVFSVTLGGVEKILYSFDPKGGSKDGLGLNYGLTQDGSRLYGTLAGGGAYNHGTLFSVSVAGAFEVVHSFGAGKESAGPNGQLINLGGTLYGVTGGGGTYGNGTVYKITP